MKNKVPLLFLLIGSAVFVSACSLLSLPESGNANPDTNGARIYYTGTTINGERIPYTGGPFTGMMMSQPLSCASCHGPDGKGGVHVMHMQVMDTPDIRISAQQNDEHDSEHASGDEAGEPEPYTIELFRQAVVDGKHPDGDSLDTEMPRWRLNQSDLEDLFAFLETLDQ